MRFELQPPNGFIPPDRIYGPRGHELSCFIPNGYEWKQINDGQGEGQVEIGGCEWGFYYSPPNGISIVLHAGQVDLNTAVKLVNDVKNKVFGDLENVKCLAIGEDENS